MLNITIFLLLKTNTTQKKIQTIIIILYINFLTINKRVLTNNKYTTIKKNN